MITGELEHEERWADFMLYLDRLLYAIDWRGCMQHKDVNQHNYKSRTVDWSIAY